MKMLLERSGCKMLGLQGNRVWGEMWQNVVCEWGRRSLALVKGTAGLGPWQASVQQLLHLPGSLQGSLHRGPHRCRLPTEALEEGGDEGNVELERPAQPHTRSHWDDSLRCGEKVDWGVYKGPSEVWLGLWSETRLAWTMGKDRHRRVKTMNTPDIVRRWLSSQKNKTDLYLISLL